MGGQLWEVIGGGDKGGILVRTGKDVASSAAPDRLGTGSLVLELALEEERLHYERLTGTGPTSGWVSLRLKDGKDLLAKTQLWEIVGGADKGGIFVRQGKDVASAAEADRLSTGALVRELELDGVRLHYERLTGTGPKTGWVSLRLDSGKELVAKTDKLPPSDSVLPALVPLPDRLANTAKEILNQGAPIALPAEIAYSLGGYDMASLAENISANHPGSHYGEFFPHTPDQLRELGADWLTNAFHKAGTLPEDNKVSKVVSQKHFEGGGAAVKAILEVEYEKPSDDLHTGLFVKMPLAPDHKNRTLNINQVMEGKEIWFNRFFTKLMPFKTAKYYYGDISMTTSNWILITEKIEFPDYSRRDEEFSPGEIEPVVRKGLDFCLPNALDKYVALYRRAAMLTAWAESGKLSDQLKDFFPVNKAGLMIGFPVMAKAFDDFWPKVEEFMLKSASQLFPAEIANSAYVAQFKDECMQVAPVLGKVNKYCTSGDGLWAFMHPNLHIDNAFFFRNERGETDCGLLDWGGAGYGFLLSQFISGGGALSLAGSDMRITYTDALVKCYFDTLAEFGGPVLDSTEMCLRVALMDMAYIIGSLRLMDTGRPGDVYEYLPKEKYADVKGLDDPAFSADSIEALMLRSVVMMFVEGVKTWKGRNYLDIFSKWRAKNPK